MPEREFSQQVCANMLASLKAVLMMTPDDGTQRSYAVRRVAAEAINEAEARIEPEGNTPAKAEGTRSE